MAKKKKELPEDERRTPTAAENESTEEEGSGLTDEALEAILADFRAELDELYENRRRRSIARSQMTDEELIASLAGDYAEVRDHAAAEGMEILTVGDGEEGEGGEDGE